MKLQSAGAAAIAVVVVAVLAVSAVYFIGSPQGRSSSVQTSSCCTSPNNTLTTTSQHQSVQGGNETAIATYTDSLVVTRASTSESTTATTTEFFTSPTETATSTATSETITPGGAFVYPTNSGVKILTVSATASQGTGSNRTLSFGVTFQNAGQSTIYVLSGGGSSLSVNIVSGPASSQPRGGPRCLVATAVTPVGPGQNHTSITPGCWSDNMFVLTSAGTIQVDMTLSWTAGTGPSAQQASIPIQAQFTF